MGPRPSRRACSQPSSRATGRRPVARLTRGHPCPSPQPSSATRLSCSRFPASWEWPKASQTRNLWCRSSSYAAPRLSSLGFRGRSIAIPSSSSRLGRFARGTVRQGRSLFRPKSVNHQVGGSSLCSGPQTAGAASHSSFPRSTHLSSDTGALSTTQRT